MTVTGRAALIGRGMLKAAGETRAQQPTKGRTPTEAEAATSARLGYREAFDAIARKLELALAEVPAGSSARGPIEAAALGVTFLRGEVDKIMALVQAEAARRLVEGGRCR